MTHDEIARAGRLAEPGELGLMFAVLGALLIGYGALASPAENAGLNVRWGFALLAFAATMLWLALRRAAARSRR